MRTENTAIGEFISEYYKHLSSRTSGASTDITIHSVEGEALSSEFTRLLVEPKVELFSLTARNASKVEQRTIYPHAFDSTAERGGAWAEFSRALEALDAASDGYSEGDFSDVSVRLSGAALAFRSASSKLERRDPLRALTSYLRRAVLSAQPHELSRASLEAMRSVIRSILAAPVISLDEAARYSDQLEKQGWDGDEPNAAKLLALVFDETQESEESVRSLLHG